ncbi:MAG: transcriptional repressor [Desulfobacterales bacterium]
MCSRCNYREILERAGLEATAGRLRVLEVVGSHPAPLSAAEIHRTVSRTGSLDRVTVYRILDRLVAKGILEELSLGGRGRLFGMAPSEQHPAHPHFRCARCGAVQCLPPGGVRVDLAGVRRVFAGEIRRVEVRAEGLCVNCLRRP